jgi:hypothetical protein
MQYGKLDSLQGISSGTIAKNVRSIITEQILTDYTIFNYPEW